MSVGKCKLTGKFGNYVRAHIVPSALTKPSQPGVPFIQAGLGGRPSRFWSSWYDPKIVTREGENILAEIDDWAVKSLRKHKLVWSGWEGDHLDASDHKVVTGTEFGIREVCGLDAAKLRLFFLSILWRAAVSTRQEFSEITMPKDDLEKLRLLVLNKNSGPDYFYPFVLTQMSSRGPHHNQSPILTEKIVPGFGEREDYSISMFRFYFDGLLLHCHLQSAELEGDVLQEASICASNKILVATILYEASAQMNNMQQIQTDAWKQWPDIMKKLDG